MTLDGQPISKFEYNKVRALLAYLMTESEGPHRREALAGLLWPDQSQKAAQDSLRNALATLRQAIGDSQADPPFLFITREAIQFNHASDHRLDLARFTNLLAASKTHPHRRLESCKSCSERLKQAVDLYQADFLQGFTLPDSDLYEDWMRVLREKYLRLAIEASQQLASIYEWRGELEPALNYARRLRELDPFREQAQQQVMRLMASMDMRAEACVDYEKFRNFLETEVGVEPDEETIRLYEQVKFGVFNPSPSRGKLCINNLPRDLTSFVGRDRELREISSLLDNPNCRLLTLVGPGGVGKTRLALAAAGHQMDVFQHGACYVPLAGINSVQFIIPTILEALSLTQGQQSNVMEQLISYLKDKELILILDNFEHLLEGAELITQLLQKAPQVTLLVTSRQRLDLQAEWLFEVDGLDYPPVNTMQDLAGYEAIQLFTQRFHQVTTRFSVLEEDLPVISRICRLVEGLPLGIELAASAVRLMSIEKVAVGIESGKEDLASSLRDIPDRHRSLRAVFEQSWRLLSEPERAVFCGLAVFRGGFTSDAALHVANASPMILSSLVERSLLRYDPQQLRYDLHELVRQYALEMLITQGKETNLRYKHLTYFTNLADQTEIRCMETSHWEQLLCMAPEADNFRTALEWCFSTAQMESSLHLIGALGYFWPVAGYWQEGNSWFEKILSCGYIFPQDEQLARVFMRAGFIFQIHNNTAGIELMNQAQEIWRKFGNLPRLAYTLSELSRLMTSEGEFDKALSLLEESLDIYHQLNDPAGTANVLNIMGEMYLGTDYLHNLEKARTFFEKSLKINRELGLVVRVSWLIKRLGDLEMNAGNFKQARSYFQESIELIKNRTSLSNLLWTIGSLGDAEIYLGDYSSAQLSFEKGLEIARNIGWKPVDILCSLSYLFYRQGEHTRAIYYLKDVFSELDTPSSTSYPVEGGLERIIGVFKCCGDPERTARLFGFVEAGREKQKRDMPAYIRPEYERDLADTRSQMGEDSFAKAWEEGRSMSLEQVRIYALEGKVIPYRGDITRQV